MEKFLLIITGILFMLFVVVLIQLIISSNNPSSCSEPSNKKYYNYNYNNIKSSFLSLGIKAGVETATSFVIMSFENGLGDEHVELILTDIKDKDLREEYKSTFNLYVKAFESNFPKLAKERRKWLNDCNNFRGPL